MKILAVDYGEKRIGLAISDELGLIAAALPVLNVSSLADAVAKVQQLSSMHKAEKIIIGVALDGEGEETQQSMQTRYFARALEDTGTSQVEFWDESFSTKNAMEIMKKKSKKTHLDSEAARIILQEFLDSKPAHSDQMIEPAVNMNLET